MNHVGRTLPTRRTHRNTKSEENRKQLESGLPKRNDTRNKRVYLEPLEVLKQSALDLTSTDKSSGHYYADAFTLYMSADMPPILHDIVNYELMGVLEQISSEAQCTIRAKLAPSNCEDDYEDDEYTDEDYPTDEMCRKSTAVGRNKRKSENFNNTRDNVKSEYSRGTISRSIEVRTSRNRRLRGGR